MNINSRFVWLLSLLLLSTSTHAEVLDFPGRAKYPGVSTYAKSQLADNLDKVVVVDARSPLEYETLRIKGAINIPVADKDAFTVEVKALRKKTEKTIIFYCNGITCFKSYRAVKLSRRAGVRNTHAYDEGLFRWAKSHPQHSVLLGKSPIKPNEIIAENKFSKHLLDADTFSNRAFAMGNKGLIVDVRDKYQRGATGLFPGREHWNSLNQRTELLAYLKKMSQSNKTLFIYDEVGKQVRWLQYSLEQAALKNYYFMDKGAKGYFSNMMKEFGIKSAL